MDYYCYILKAKNPRCARRYVGMTNNIERRLKQHNGLLAGGARYTKRHLTAAGGWEFAAIIGGFPDKINCLSCEWRLKHPWSKTKEGRRKRASATIAEAVYHVLGLERWSENAAPNCETDEIIAWLAVGRPSGLLSKLIYDVELPPNVCVIECDFFPQLD